jgi:queuine tRNA-ribosyltransferase
MPDGLPKYAMGVGKPEGIAACARMGYNLFDCVIPTREARHNRLYVFNEAYTRAADIDPYALNFYAHFHPADDAHRRDARPVSHLCDCHTCANHSRAYLRHLLHIGDATGQRLATLHNLRFYTMLMEALRR